MSGSNSALALDRALADSGRPESAWRNRPSGLSGSHSATHAQGATFAHIKCTRMSTGTLFRLDTRRDQVVSFNA